MERSLELFDRLKTGGVQELQLFIQSRSSEELFLDFKQAATVATDSTLKDDDRKNLAKAISGFGNSEGGIIVWGVDCRNLRNDPADVARALKEVDDAASFKSRLENAVSGCTAPAHSQVEHFVIPGSVAPKGYVVTLIPRSEFAPLEFLAESRYYLRIGSNFHPAPRQILAGMFGRKPQPDVIINFLRGTAEPWRTGFKITWGLLVKNLGVIPAKEVYLGMNFLSRPCVLELDNSNLQTIGWTGHGILQGHIFSYYSPPNYRLLPSGMVCPISMTLCFEAQLQSNLTIEFNYGCENSFPRSKLYNRSATDLNAAIAIGRAALASGTFNGDIIAEAMFPIGQWIVTS